MRLPFYMLFLSCIAFAEAVPSGQTPGAATQTRGVNPNAIPVFDSDFFNKVGPATEKPGSFEGSASPVTSDVRAKFISECESKKAIGMAEFSKCYREKESAAASSREKEIDRVNTKSNLPLRNTPKLIEEMQSKPMQDND